MNHDFSEILKHLPHRYPFLFVDKIVSVELGNTIHAQKNVSINEDFFNGHFPNKPVMPGVLIIEAMAQAGGILALSVVPDPENYLTFFMKMDKVKFKQKVVSFPEVLQCFLVMGDIDFILLVATRTIEDYNRFVQNKLAQIPGVQSIDSRIVIEETKNTTELPLGLV